MKSSSYSTREPGDKHFYGMTFLLGTTLISESSPEARAIQLRATALATAARLGLSEAEQAILKWDPRTQTLESAVPALAQRVPADPEFPSEMVRRHVNRLEDCAVAERAHVAELIFNEIDGYRTKTVRDSEPSPEPEM